jgi:undecaprenyl phosphate-alpha-L-ara4FN deformylase
VDTHIGMKRGVPRLLAILREFNVRGTFFLSMGPDASGRAVLQLIKNPLFLKKMVRTGAGRLYGWRTALYGTLLPSPMIALSSPDLVGNILSAGHDAEFHAWDHRRWQDELPARSYGWIENWFEKGVDAYRRMTGKSPLSFGAPAWLIDERALEIIAQYSFQYLSCTRAREPFIHDIPGLLEIPSDLPCFEEIGVDEGVSRILRILEDGQTHILPVHAEAEGGIWDRYFVELLKGALQMHYLILPLSEIREILRPSEWPVRRHRMERLPGRSAPCAV